MNRVEKGSFEQMKQLNISAILEVVRMRVRISRAEIAEITGLTPASVTNITKQLIKNNFLRETGIGESSGGRPPVMIELNPEAGFIVGVNLGPGIIEVVMANLEAKILLKKVRNIGEENSSYVMEMLFQIVDEVIKESGKPEEKIIGIGLAVHGIVNSITGVSEFAPYYHWKKLPVKELMEERFGFPVFVDNDVRAMAAAESWFGAAKGISNFITINVSNGVGSGIVIDSKPYYGVDFSAGEIGHVVVDTEGPKCSCGNYGCLESMASNISIIKKAQKLIRQGVETELSKLDIDKITVIDICEAANNGDKAAEGILVEIGRYIGIAASNIVNILNPKQVIMVGEIMKSKDIVLKSIKETIMKAALELPASNIKILPSALRENTAVVGAVTLVLKEVFTGKEIK